MSSTIPKTTEVTGKASMDDFDCKDESIATTFGSVLAQESIQQLMTKEGPVVKAVVLESSGTVKEVTYDSTPKKNVVQSLLNGLSPTIIGEWHELGVILVKGVTDSTSVLLNKHSLRHPFHHLSGTIRGDIFLYRLDEDAVNKDFTADEYLQFIQKPLPESIHEEGTTVEEGADEEEVTDGPPTTEFIRAIIVNKIKSDFPERFGREPTEEEIESFYEATLQKFSQNFGSISTIPAPTAQTTEEDGADSGDEDYDPEEDAQQAMEDIVDEQFLEDDTKLENAEEEEIDMEDPSFFGEFQEALRHVRGLGIHDRKKILEAASATYKKETGAEVSASELADAFSLLGVVSGSTDMDGQQTLVHHNTLEDITENPADEEAAEAKDEEEEEGNAMDAGVEAKVTQCGGLVGNVREQLDAAIAHIQNVGKAHGEVLAEKISQSFAEFNDREPTFKEMKQIFGRVKDLFKKHGGADINSTTKQKISFKQAMFADVIKQPDAIRTCVVRAAQSVVLEDLQVQACRAFLDANLRVPNEEELRSCVRKMAFDLFGELAADKDNEDGDYDPNNADDQRALERDLIDDGVFPKTKKYFYYGKQWRNKMAEIRSFASSFSSSKGSKPDFVTDVGAADDEEAIAGATISQPKQMTTVKKQIEVLTTPVREKRNSCRMDIYFEQPETMKRFQSAKKQLGKITQSKQASSNDFLADFLKVNGMELETQKIDVEFEMEVDENQENIQPSIQ